MATRNSGAGVIAGAGVSRRLRRVLVLGIALSFALASAPSLATAASANPGPTLAAQPSGPYSIRITKLEQPDAVQQPASGLPIADPSAVGPAVSGATFSAWRVPGIDLETNAGQQQAAELSVEEAVGLTDVSTTPSAQDTTDAEGNATLSDLPAGLYYVKESRVPTGFVGAAPFLVALPLTDPHTRASWLSTVHVYPKNARASTSLNVVDADAVRIGDTVRWFSRSDVPAGAVPDAYRVVQRIDPRLRLSTESGAISVRLEGVGAPTLTLGRDYSLVVDSGSQQITVEMLPPGLDALARFASAQGGARLRIEYQTDVLRDGELTNEALLYPSQAAVAGGPDAPQPLSDKASTRWGPVAAQVYERGNPKNLIAGTTFELYLSEADARSRSNPIQVAGIREWRSDAQGRLLVSGLRFSNFVNGIDRDPTDPLYRHYFLVPTSFPAGWIGEHTPLRTVVTSTTQPTVLEVVLWRLDDSSGRLPVTGAQIAGAWMFAAVLLAGGTLLLVRRRRTGGKATDVRPEHRATKK